MGLRVQVPNNHTLTKNIPFKGDPINIGYSDLLGGHLNRTLGRDLFRLRVCEFGLTLEAGGLGLQYVVLGCWV